MHAVAHVHDVVVPAIAAIVRSGRSLARGRRTSGVEASCIPIMDVCYRNFGREGAEAE